MRTTAEVRKRCLKPLFTIFLSCENRFSAFDSVPLGQPCGGNFVTSEKIKFQNFLQNKDRDNQTSHCLIYNIFSHYKESDIRYSARNLILRISKIVKQDLGHLFYYLLSQ